MLRRQSDFRRAAVWSPVVWRAVGRGRGRFLPLAICSHYQEPTSTNRPQRTQRTNPNELLPCSNFSFEHTPYGQKVFNLSLQMFQRYLIIA